MALRKWEIAATLTDDASYLISLYCSAAILTEDAVAVLDGVEVDKYHDYQHAYRK